MKKILLFLMFFSSFAFSMVTPPDRIFVSNAWWINPTYYSERSATSITCDVNFVRYMGWIGDKQAVEIYKNHVSANGACNAIAVTWQYQTNFGFNPPPTCTSPAVLTNGICVNPTPVCEFGYHNDTTPQKTCVPDVTCPPTMKYFAKYNPTQLDYLPNIKTCVPNSDISPSECVSQGGMYFELQESLDDELSRGALAYGKGCADRAYLQNRSQWDNISFAVSGLLPSINTAYLAQFGNTLFSGGKYIKDMIAGFFKTDDLGTQQGLLAYKPTVLDVVIQSDGTYAVMNYDAQVYKSAQDLGLVDNVVPNTVTTPVNIIPDNVYLGGDISKFEANIIGTKSFLDDLKPLDIPDTSPLNTVATSTLNLKNSLYGSQTSSFPVTSTLLEKATDSVGTVTTLTRSKINYPDGSYSSVTSLAKKFADATKTYDITVTTPIETTTGLKIYEQKSTLTQNASGVTTNAVTSPATVSFVDSSGRVVSSPNTSVSTAPQTETGNISLANVQTALNQINATLTQTKTALLDAVNHIPVNTTAYNTATQNFKNAFTDLHIGIANGFDFIEDLQNTFSDLQNQLDDALALFEDKPTISLPSGSCPFNATWYGEVVVVDPCMFVAPYRPIMVLFLTFFMSFSVLMFALKYLFNVSLGGK